jgi:hypothetical protein
MAKQDFLNELVEGFGNAVDSIREHVVEEGWYGRIVNDRQPEAAQGPEPREQVAQEVEAPEQNREQAPDLDR